MILDEPVSFATLSGFLAEQIRILEVGDDTSAIGNNFTRVSGLPSQQQTFPGTDTTVPAHKVILPGYSFYLWGGTQNYSQAATLARAYVDPEFSPAYPGVSGGIAIQAGRVLNSTPTFPDPPDQRTVLAGHSQGGTVALAGLVYPLLRNRTRNISVATFGAPRTGGIDFIRAVTGIAIVRWMCDNDPVPLLPPSFAAAPSMFLAGNVNISAIYEYYRHTTGGVVLAPNGQPSGADLPPYGRIGAAVDLASFLLTEDEGVRTAHSITAYIERLALLAAVQNVGPRVQVDPAPVEPARTTARRTTNVQTASVIQQIQQAGHEQQVVNIVVPPYRAFRTVKFEGMWFVTFGGALVAAAPTKKRAGGLARVGNDFLRRLQRQAAVDTDSLKSLFPQYLDAASDPTGEFKPPIHPFNFS